MYYLTQIRFNHPYIPVRSLGLSQNQIYIKLDLIILVFQSDHWACPKIKSIKYVQVVVGRYTQGINGMKVSLQPSTKLS